jgi:hypothetical protein
MATKFFHAENATRILAGIRFDIYDINAGTAVGIFKTDDEALAKALADLPAVIEIPASEYEICFKKKQPKYEILNASKPVSNPAIASLKGPGNAVIVDEPTPQPEPVPVLTGLVDESDALKVVKIEEAAPVVPPVVVSEPVNPPVVAPPVETVVAPLVAEAAPAAEPIVVAPVETVVSPAPAEKVEDPKPSRRNRGNQ